MRRKVVDISNVQLRRTACPPTRIPRFSGRTWVCDDPVLQVYTLGDGNKCCRKGKIGAKTTKPQGRKEKKFTAKEDLPPVVYKPADRTKIRNPWTGRWVKITGDRGKQVVATFGLPK